MDALVSIITKLGKYNQEPLTEEPFYIKYIINFLNKPDKYLELPFLGPIKPFTITYFLVKNGFNCRADRVKSFPFAIKTVEITCQGLFTYLFILNKKSFLASYDTEKAIKERLTELTKNVVDKGVYIEEETEDGINYFSDEDPNFLPNENIGKSNK